MTWFNMLHPWYGVCIIWLFRFQPGWLFSRAYPATETDIAFSFCEEKGILTSQDSLAIHMSTYLSFYMIYSFFMLQRHLWFSWFDSQHRSGMVTRPLFSFGVLLASWMWNITRIAKNSIANEAVFLKLLQLCSRRINEITKIDIGFMIQSRAFCESYNNVTHYLD